MTFDELFAQARAARYPGELFEALDGLDDGDLIELRAACERLAAAVWVIRDRHGEPRPERPSVLATLSERAGTSTFAADKGDYQSAHQIIDSAMIRALLEIRAGRGDAADIARVVLSGHRAQDRRAYYGY